jgi:hypothetical protein
MRKTLQNSTQEELIHKRVLVTVKSYYTVLQTLHICWAWIHRVLIRPLETLVSCQAAQQGLGRQRLKSQPRRWVQRDSGGLGLVIRLGP